MSEQDYTHQEVLILNMIYEYCDLCFLKTKCPEGDCILYKIEKLIVRDI